MYSYIGACITHLDCDIKDRILYISAKQLPDDGFVIEHDCILLPFVHELHCHPVLHPSNNDSGDTVAHGKHLHVDWEQAAVRRIHYGTPHSENCLAGKLISYEYFDILDHQMNQWSPFSCLEEYRFAH